MSEIEQSAGSADKEMGIIQESLDYKINALKETWTGIFQNLIDRGVIGNIIDILTQLSEVIEKITSNITGVQMLFSTITASIIQIKTKGNFDWIEQFKNLGSSLMEFMSIRETSSAQIIEQSNAETQSINNETAALVQEEVQATTTSKAMVLLKSVVNALITSAIIFGVTKLVQLFDDWVHRTERLADAAKKAKDEISNINKSFTELKNTTNGVKQRYAELAQGVANLGTAFQSQGNLSTEEYEEFLDLSNQLAELYPVLTKGFDDNGNAILDLSGSVNTIVGSLDNLIERERILARTQVGEKMPNIWENNANRIKSFGIQIDEAQRHYEDYTKAIEFFEKNRDKSFSADTDSEFYTSLYDDETHRAIAQAFTDAKLEWDKYYYIDSNNSLVYNFQNFTDTEIEALSDALHSRVKQYNEELRSYQDEIKQINAEMVSNIQEYLSGDFVFLGLSKEMQRTALEIFSNFDMSNLPKKDMSWEELAQWYHDNILNALNDINDKDIQEKIGKLFSGEGTLKEATDLYVKIYQYFKSQDGFNPEDPLIVHIKAEFESQQNELNKAVKKLTNNVEENRKASYGKFFSDFLIDKEDKFISWISNDLSIPDNVIYTTQELLDLYDEWLQKTKEITTETKKMRTAADAVDSIAKVESAVSSLSDIYWSTVKKAPNATADDLKNWGTATATQLNSIEDAFNYLIKDEDKDKQEKLTAALEEFEATLVHFPNDSKKAEDAINKLVTSYINESSVLEDLTEENKSYAIARLKAIGIDNAEEVVQSRLTEQVKATTKAVKALREELKEYNEALEQKIENPEKYATALKSLADKTKEAMAMRDANGNVLKDENGVERYFEVSPQFVENHIETIKKMLAGDQEAFKELQKELEKAEFSTILKVNLPEEAVEPYFDYLWKLIDETNLKEIEIGADLDDSAFLASLNAMVGNSWEYAEQIAKIFKYYGIDLTIARQFGKTGANGMSSQAAAYLDKNGPFTGAKKIGDAGLGKPAETKPEAPKDSKGSSADKEKTEYEKAMEILKELREADLISEKEYLDQKRKLIEQLWKDGKMKAEEYFKAIHEWLKEMLTYYNQVISDVTKILNKQKDKLEKERDKRVKAIEEERDAELKAIDEETKALEEKIKIKQKEIDELQKANEARKQAIDLQKAEYELQRSMYQRTNLVYKEGFANGPQMVYQTDPKAIKEAKENLEEKKYEKRLSILEKELDVLNEQKDKLSEQREQIEEHYQTLLDETNKYYDEAIKRIDEYIEKWESLAEAEENALMESRLASLGLSLEDILSFDDGAFESFKSMYLGLLNDIYGDNALMQESLKGTWGELPGYMEKTAQAMKGLNGLDLTSFDNAVASLSNGNKAFKDLDPDSWATDLEGIATKYGAIGTEASGAASTAATAATEASEVAVKATENVIASAEDFKNLLDGGTSNSSETTKDTRYRGPSDIPSNGGRSSGPTGSLIDALNDTKEVSNVAIGSEQGVKGDFDTANDSIMTATTFIDTFFSKLKEYTSGTYTIKIQTQMTGYSLPNLSSGGTKPLDFNEWNDMLSGKTKYFGTVGTAFYDGYPGLPSDELNALRSEYGQPELTVYPNGTYELTTTPTLSDLPKDTVIFNEEQTKRILKDSASKVLKGKSFASGTSYLPLQDVMPDKAEMFNKFASNIQDNLSKMKFDIADMSSNLQDITRTITNNMVNNNGNTVNVGNINVTCPGVTEAEVVKNLGAAIRSELNGVVSGMALKANQRAMRR